MNRGALAALAAVVCSAGGFAQSPVVVDESRIHADLRDGSTVVTIPLANSSGRAIAAKLELAWLNPADYVLASVQRPLSVAPGRSSVDIPLPLADSSIWLRLRYSLTPPAAGDPRAFTAQRGVVAISQIDDHVFELNTAIGVARRGAPFTVHAQAIQPRTRKQVAGVSWSAVLSLDDEQLQPSRTVDLGLGFVDFVFEIPELKDEDQLVSGELEVDASLGDFKGTGLTSVMPFSRRDAQIQTDKPIYQPGQTIHVRALVLDDAGKAADGEAVRLVIKNDDDDEMHSADLTASKFGIVANDWDLPPNADLGTYSIQISLPDDGDALGSHRVRVSRYELPAFSVSAKLDKSSYLPGESAHAEIRGTYLFGKPVPGGTVKLERSDKTTLTGQADASGTFSAALDLTHDFDGLNQWQRFNDLEYAAYFTDPSSGRTEQRKFTVRITRESIHVYIVSQRAYGALPMAVYLSTFYADGRAASTDIEIRSGVETLHARSNAFGVARVFLTPEDEGNQEIFARAVDNSGAQGTWTENLYRFHQDPTLRVDTNRTLLRSGEDVSLHITSPESSGAVLVDAQVDSRSVATRVVGLKNGQADVTFPYQPEFRGEVEFLAWGRGEEQGGRGVIFPDDEGLRITLTPDKAAYRPGEKASLRMSVASKDGQPVESVLGLAIVDQAVEERARTDNQFGRRSWFSCWACADASRVGDISLDDLTHLDPSKPIPDGLDLVAEMLTMGVDSFRVKGDEGLRNDRKSEFSELFRAQMKQLQTALDGPYLRTLDYPRDAIALRAAAGAAWTNLHDPWGTRYQAEFKVHRNQDVLSVLSAGPDKTFGTADDFSIGQIERPYFLPAEILIKHALATQPDYPASSEALAQLLAENGLALDQLRDPWGTPYRAEVDTSGPKRIVSIRSAGPDRRFGTGDDFDVAVFQGRYFTREIGLITRALSAAAAPPDTEAEFRKVLAGAGIDLAASRDPWGHPYRLMSTDSAQYNDRRSYSTVQVYGGPATTRTQVTPVTRRFHVFSLWSAGPDGIEGDDDDFAIEQFPVFLREESARSDAPHAATSTPHGTGAIAGVVLDQSGAVIPGAKVFLLIPEALEATSDNTGRYRFDGVADGIYSIEVDVTGFRTYRMLQVPVKPGATTIVDIVLEVGAVSETVTVTEAAAPLNTEASDIAGTVVGTLLGTPRVRDYFPETLLWNPELLTDPQGRARLRFTLADSVTTWKVAAIASTLDGRVAEAETDLRAFQPFFLELNPPPMLTSGDRIDLPVTVRNYTSTQRKISLQLQPNGWSKPQTPAKQTLTVASNASANAVYPIRATRADDSARQRVIALAGISRDAIEKSLRVHPDGQRSTQTFGDIASGPISFTVPVPATAIQGATRAEAILYPNLLAVLLDSAEGLLERPHGCAEQTTSGGYTNLTALRYARAIGAKDPRLEKKALANIRIALDALPGFKTSAGGISYWQHSDDPDIAVTAYVLNFLADASKFTEVDQDFMQALVQWLERSQRKGGEWGEPDPSLQVTAVVARALTAARDAGADVAPTAIDNALRAVDLAAPEPYSLALFLMSDVDARFERNDVALLRSLAREEKGALYWDQQANTPFYGWGRTGRIETSGLVVSALARWRARHPEAKDLDSTIRRGLIFLLRNRDQFGAWYSTQATLRAMQAVVDVSQALGDLGGMGGSVEVRVNGKAVKTIPFPDDPRSADPLRVDLSAWLAWGENRIELIPSSGTKAAIVRVTEEHWTPWAKSKPPASDALRFTVKFDRTHAAPGEPIRCSLTAERVGFRGYGMILAEVGLPPGAEVDRASLEALKDVYRYDVLPDRVILYLWPKAGGVTLDFAFWARMGMDALSEPSRLYDYYNPESQTEIPPQHFEIQ